jgi:putrescine aminotransferase
MTAGSAGTFEFLRQHVSPGFALGAKVAGAGAVEADAKGAVVRLSDGRELLDFGSYAVTLLGHRHPRVVDAVTMQLQRMPTSTRMLANPMTAGLIGDLVERVGGSLEQVWLGSDGADAVEVATKLALKRSGRPRVLAARGAFHGKTLGALALTWNPAFRDGLESMLSHVTHVDPGDPDAVRREVAAGDVAALVFEPIQGEAGVRPLDLTLLRRWSADAHAGSAYVISDEIQTGMRRCGPLSVALDAGLEPDAVLLGKALGGGIMPLSALLATRDLYAPLRADPTWHSATFGGHPLACAAGRAALRVVDELQGRASELAARVEAGLRDVVDAAPATVTAVRGRGLMWGVEFVSSGVAGNMLVELGQRGVLVSPCLSAPRTIRLLPPMVATDAEVDRALEIFAKALELSEDFADGDDDVAP